MRGGSNRATSTCINAPYNGGTHLPDITVCTPVFDDRKKSILFWVASRGHHADVGGISPGSMSPQRDDDRRGRRPVRQLQARRSRPLPREGALRRADRREISGAQSAAERQRHEGADRRQREGRRRAAQDGGALHAAGREGLHEPRAGQRGRERAPRDRPPARFIVRVSDGPRHHDPGEDLGRQGEARGDRRLHRHLGAAEQQFQRARAGDARRRALRVPRDGRRRHPDERRLPAPDQHRHPEAHDADAASIRPRSSPATSRSARR